MRVAIAGLLALGAAEARAQVYNVGTEAALMTAIANAYDNSLADGSAITTINLTADINATQQMTLNANMVINGGGFTLDMNNSDRAFFVFGGTVTLSNLTIANGNATGGSGSGNAGGGAGLGGAIFVGSGTYETGVGTTISGISNTALTLNVVQFVNNSATGGAAGVSSRTAIGGGGGMGGNGGAAVQENDTSTGCGGGGGLGVGAAGGDGGYSGGAGGMGGLQNIPELGTQAGPGGFGGGSAGGPGGVGGAYGGGGGGGSYDGYGGSGGGGGLGGAGGHVENGDSPDGGGAGGFGGGGGGSVSVDPSGQGGFGGGGGGNWGYGDGGAGGFGGGGGSSATGTPGVGGFGGGDAVVGYSGGGGMGAGAAIFVMNGASVTINDGSFSGSVVTGGAGKHDLDFGNTPGSAIGADLFLGNDVTFNVTTAMTLQDLGGAGNLNDPNVSAHANDPNAQGGLIKTGVGVLTLQGNSYYSGGTVVNQGVLSFSQGALEVGASQTVVGSKAGDDATLMLMDGNTYSHADYSQELVIAQYTGSKGKVVIGSGETTQGADIGVGIFSGGGGEAGVVFAQGEVGYQFLTTLTGSIRVTQDGPGSTLLRPVNGPNIYAGGTEVKQGTLEVAGNAALGSGEVQVKGGTFAATGGTPISNEVTMSGGTYTVEVNEAGSYAGMANAQSGFGDGRDTTATLLGGQSSTGVTLVTSFATTSTALNDNLRLSDVYSFSGTGTDIFVLELSMTGVGAGSYLGWLNTEGNLWVNAVDGNTGNNATALQQGYLGSFADFQKDNGTNLSSYIGAYGTDTATGSTWAVVNHNSDFSVVPEPSTWALVILGVLAAATLRRRIGRAGGQAGCAP